MKRIPLSERRWLRVPEAAKIARTNIPQIRKLIRRGQLPAINLHRYYVIDRLDLDAYLLVSAGSPVRTSPPKRNNT